MVGWTLVVVTGADVADAIFKLPLTNIPNTLSSLRERYDQLVLRSETLPYEFNMRTPPEMDLSLVIQYLPKDFFKSASGSHDTTDAVPEDASVTPVIYHKTALMLALAGWQEHVHPRLGQQMGSVSCQACYRILGLWLFKSKELNNDGEVVKEAAMNCLDVVKEHRDYCPWRDPSSQNGSRVATPDNPLLAGWEVVLRTLRNYYYLRHGGHAELDRARTGTTLADDNDDDDNDKSVREARDKERWARLRRVKSLFDPKKKIARTASQKTAREV